MKQFIKRSYWAVVLSAVSLPGCETVLAPVPMNFVDIPRSAYLSSVEVCRGIRVSNAPPSSARIVKDFSPVVSVTDKVDVLTAPVSRACLSSGFGKRGSRLHKGVDLASAVPAEIVSAAGGRVLIAEYRGGYGNMVLVEHGDGIHTRYAHLQTIADEIFAGAEVAAGQFLGITGTTGNVTGRHLHYEILTGKYRSSSAKRGLKPIDVFSLPAAIVSEGQS